jgi:hypothetical protein
MLSEHRSCGEEEEEGEEEGDEEGGASIHVSFQCNSDIRFSFQIIRNVSNMSTVWLKNIAFANLILGSTN